VRADVCHLCGQMPEGDRLPRPLSNLVCPVCLARPLNLRGGITPEMALRIEPWLGMQLDYDLWQARKHAPKRIQPTPAIASTSQAQAK
jgi:hypothetical protein